MNWKLIGMWLLFLIGLTYMKSQTQDDELSTKWQAHWITAPESKRDTNTWQCFRKEVNIKEPPAIAIAKIAVDSKYWLWINGQMVIFEGGLKRGPTAEHTYFDEVNIAPYLKKGKNTIAVLVWYFGKNGFSHNSSGKAGMVFQCIAPGLKLLSDQKWTARINPAYVLSPPPHPNFRLPESNVYYDARKDLGNWQYPAYNGRAHGFDAAKEIGIPPCAPWNDLVKRLIPQWKNYGLKNYVNIKKIQGDKIDTIVAELPYDAQITPYLEIVSAAGNIIDIHTDAYTDGGALNVRAGYITRQGRQDYESYGWMNGNKVYYLIPKGIKVLSLKYRETGYNTSFAGDFKSSDPFLNSLWRKARRTLYITMRDTYMDCPDRERAQWLGDEVIESGEAFYALDSESHSLQRKGMYELIGWQKADSTLFGPIPAGNWDKELPCQVLADVGYYGFWNYYLNTGDIKPIHDLYHGVKKYLALWKLNDQGTIIFRKGGWTWGDWGADIDKVLLENAWYYLALKGIRNMAEAIGEEQDAIRYEQMMVKLKKSFNKQFWTGRAYRSPAYQNATDDRCQALAVVSELADKDKYPALLQVLKQEVHASPYMEKYVIEALFKMGDTNYALARIKKRFGPMVNNPDYTTLFEGWGIGKHGYGGGTFNHAWSGGGLTILSQYLCGIAPVEPGYKIFNVIPHPGTVKWASATVASVKGTIKSSFANNKRQFTLKAKVPDSTIAIIGIPIPGVKIIKINGSTVWEGGHYFKNNQINPFEDGDSGYIKFKLGGGVWNCEGLK